LKTFLAVFLLAFSSLARADPVIVGDQRIIINQRADPFQLRQVIKLNINANGIEGQKIVSSRATMKITPPFGLDENQTFPWATAEKVVVGLLKTKSGGKRNRNVNGKNIPYYYYSLEVDPLIVLRGEKQLSLQLRRKNDLRLGVSNALRKLSKEIEGSVSFDFSKAQPRLDELLEDEKLGGEFRDDLKYVRASYNGVHEEEPDLPDEEELVFIALSGTSSTKKLSYWESITSSNAKHIKRLLDLPYGWTFDKHGKAVSPWSEHGNQSHMGDDNSSFVCSRSGRAYSPADKGLTLSVSKIPSEFIQSNNSNRDGDGFFSIKLSNPTEFPLSIPALRRNKGGILWKESLACLVSSTNSSNINIITNSVCLPKFSSLDKLKETDPTILEPGQEISTTVNPLLFSNFPEITGYSQLSFRFCLGKTVALSTFYYNSSYHDKIKLKIRAGIPTRPISLGD
jgi:hypothetical protein